MYKYYLHELKKKKNSHEFASQEFVSLTILSKEVDDGVCFTVPVQVSQLCTAVHGHVMDTQSPLTTTAGV